MRTGMLALLVLLAGCSAAAPKADQRSPRPVGNFAQGPGPYNFDCDAKSEHYDQLNIRSPGGKIKVTGSFRFLTNRGVEHTYPYVTFRFVEPKGQPQTVLTAVVTNSDVTWFGIRHAAFQPDFAKEAFTYSSIPISLSIDETGKVTGSIDGYAVPGGENVSGFRYLKLTCSTAHVIFSDIALVALE